MTSVFSRHYPRLLLNFRSAPTHVSVLAWAGVLEAKREGRRVWLSLRRGDPQIDYLQASVLALPDAAGQFAADRMRSGQRYPRSQLESPLVRRRLVLQQLSPSQFTASSAGQPLDGCGSLGQGNDFRPVPSFIRATNSCYTSGGCGETVATSLLLLRSVA